MAPEAEAERILARDQRREAWDLWGPYLSERQWGTVREDYRADGDAWNYFPHDHARSRVYRWGEDGLLGFCDIDCRLCFSTAFWNGADPILKEGHLDCPIRKATHGEDLKDTFTIWTTHRPTASCALSISIRKRDFPMSLVAENARRTRLEPEFELIDFGIPMKVDISTSS